jgi:hypothetical protein
MARGKSAEGKGKGAEGRGKGAEQKQAADDPRDALFQLPLAEFTAARNALATRLKKGGDAEEAERVKALVKPSISAWAVNQVFWRHRAAFDRLIAAGEKFRQAQASQLAGESTDIRGTLDARREALAETSKLAAALLTDTGSNATPDMMRRVTTTLEALSTYGALPDGPPAGRLTDDVDPPGFESLAALVPRIGHGKDASSPSRVLNFQPDRRPKRAAKKSQDPAQAEEERKARAEAAKAALQEAERALREARKAAQDAESALKKAAARAKEAEKNKAEAEARLEKATADADAAKQDARRVAEEAEDAAQAVEDAERAVARAQEMNQ